MPLRKSSAPNLRRAPSCYTRVAPLRENYLSKNQSRSQQVTSSERKFNRSYQLPFASSEGAMIRKLVSGEYRLYSRKKNPKTGKRRNLGTFASRAAAEKHERAVQFYKHHA